MKNINATIVFYVNNKDIYTIDNNPHLLYFIKNISALFRLNYIIADINANELPPKLTSQNQINFIYSEKLEYLPEHLKNLKFIFIQNSENYEHLDINFTKTLNAEYLTENQFVFNDDIIYFFYNTLKSQINVNEEIAIKRTPILNKLLLLIATKISEIFGITINIWPSKYKYAFSSTHDIDSLTYYSLTNVKRYLNAAFKNLDFSNLLFAGSQFFKTMVNFGEPAIIPFENYKKIEYKHSINSDYFFVFQDKRRNANDPLYLFSDAYQTTSLPQIINNLLIEGNSVNLHLSLSAQTDQKILISEIERLKVITNFLGVRAHHLTNDLTNYCETLKKYNILFDSSFGYNRENGFIKDICLPFMPIEMFKYGYSNFLEFPIILMDTALLKKYKDDYKKIEDKVDEIIDIVKSMSGHLVVNWHCWFMDYNKTPEMYNIYKLILEKISADSDCWRAKLAEVYNHFLFHS